MAKILIVKLGMCEFLDHRIETTISLGDVFRCTPLLYLYKNDNVTWLASKESASLLKGNRFINRILTYDLTTVLQLQTEHFDTIVNLEKVPGICALTNNITAWRKLGFRFNITTGKVEAYHGAQRALSVSSNLKLKKISGKKGTFQDFLFELVGEKWKGEEYILGYKPKGKELYDVGFNTEVGPKWPNKAWGLKSWKKLEKLLAPKKLRINWQQGLSDIKKYIDWLNSCRLIITSDSLALHLALGLKKKVIALFGPTSPIEVYMYKHGSIMISSSPCRRKPCFNPVCKSKRTCMEYIKAEDVYKEILKQLYL